MSTNYPRLFAGDATTFTSNGITVLTDAIKCEVTEERNGAFELELEIATSNPYFDQIEVGALIVAKPNHSQNPQAFEIYEISKPINQRVKVRAHHISYRASFIPVLPFEAMGIEDAIDGLNNNAQETNPFTITTNIANTTSTYKQTVPGSLRSRLGGSEGSLLDIFGGEYLWDNWDISLLQSRGTDNGVSLRLGKNITDLTQTFDFSNVVTGALPIWVKDKTMVVGSVQYSAAVSDYAYPRTVILDLSDKYENQPTTTQLNQSAQTYLQDNGRAIPNDNVKINFVDLADTTEYKDFPSERINLCDTVEVVYEALGIDYKAKVIKIKYDVLADRTVEAEIGKPRQTLAQAINGVVQQDEGSNTGVVAVSFLDSWPQARPITANIAPTSDARMFHFLSSSTMTEGKPDSDGHIVNFQWDNSNVVGTELYLHNRANNHNVLGVRGGQAGGTWNDWAYADIRRELWTGTTQGGSNISLDCTAYSFIKVWVHAYATIFPVIIDLTKAPGRTRADATGNTAFRGSAAAPVVNTSNTVSTYTAVIELNAAKTTVYIRNIGYYRGTTWTSGNSNAEYYAFKIEGYL